MRECFAESTKMSISQDKILPLFVKKTERIDMIGSLVREILVLEERIGNIEGQSFYFQMGLRSQTNRLNELRKTYEKYRALINKNTVDYFTRRLKDAEAVYRRCESECRMRPNVINLIAMSGCEANVVEWENLVRAKERYDLLRPLDEYKDGNVELSVFFG